MPELVQLVTEVRVVLREVHQFFSFMQANFFA